MPLSDPAHIVFPSAAPAVLRASLLSFSYGSGLVLDSIDLHVNQGEFVALAGPNGSGKSTLLRILLGLTKPMTGTVELFGHPPGTLKDRGRIGYVPQKPGLAGDLPATVEEVVQAGRLARIGWRGHLRSADKAEIDQALEAVALSDQRKRQMRELSGGQQQRAFIAKALVAGPELLVLDEPVAGVDADSQHRFRDSLIELVNQKRCAVLLVSHELGAVAGDLDRVMVLQRGKVRFDGPPAELTATGVSLGVHHEDLPVWLEGLK